MTKVFGSDAYHQMMLQEKDKLPQDDFFSIFFFHRCLIDTYPSIIGSPVNKLVFLDYLSIWSLVLGIMTGGVFEGDESAVPIAVFEVAGFIFFSGIRI